ADDDDYLSDKFLAVTEPQKSKTYSEKRKEALRRSLLEDEQNKTKSNRQLELESREEGLSKSLFERAQDDKASGRGSENKALSIMMKMGFKPGRALGVPTDVEDAVTIQTTPPPLNISSPEPSVVSPGKHEGQLVNPLPLNEWSGTKGIGLGKRAPSPTELERLAKVAKAAEEAGEESFRSRSRRGFEQKRAEARLGPAQRTCVTLDERAGKEFNVLWLDPTNPDTFPANLVDAMIERGIPAWAGGAERPTEERLREQMQADALGPLGDNDGEDLPKKADFGEAFLSPEIVEEAAQFLHMDPAERLAHVLQYLRAEYHYCFWCGTQYKSSDEMQEECPGPDEDMHD
ncbi:hypothetical protein BJV74DRAFT_730695, partial [Russula compacta]